MIQILQKIATYVTFFAQKQRFDQNCN